MKNFNTLEELREALMSEDGAVYATEFRFRLDGLNLQINNKGKWLNDLDANHGFLFAPGNWTRYEKPKKIVKESFEGFVSEYLSKQIQKDGSFDLCSFSKEKNGLFNQKATITIEREVEE